MCLTDKVNNIQCVYERVTRRKTTLLYDNIKRICPEESICSFHTDNDVFYANQMITKNNFQTYYISNFKRKREERKRKRDIEREKERET